MTFLELCQAYRSELGIPGSGPTSVTPPDGELAKIVRDIKNAEVDVKRRWQDWKFLRRTHDTIIQAGSRTPEVALPPDINMWDPTRFRLNYGTTSVIRLTAMDYLDFEERVDSWTAVSGPPEVITWDRNQSLQVDPIPEEQYTLRGTYWLRAVAMTQETEVSIIPEQFHRIIIARAKIHYAEREDAPEITSGAVAEFEDLMEQLEANQLPGQHNRKFASAPEPGVVRPM